MSSPLEIKNPALRADAGSRTNSETEPDYNRPSAIDCEADAEALAPVESDAPAARLWHKTDDDTGARYHLKRVVECVKAAPATLRELETRLGVSK
jgi:hypothetical protein